MNILITGGAGYIGSNTSFKLIKESSHSIFLLDNLEKGHQENLDILKEHAGDFTFINADLRNLSQLEEAFENLKIDLVIHFAAYLEVGLSVKKPEIFIENNVVGTQNLLKVMLANGLRKFIFSSSAAVYGTQDLVPIPETATKKPDSPYGSSKYLMEEILKIYSEYKDLDVVALRYFNPAGSFQGLLGERHIPETHVIPRLLRAFMNQGFSFGIYGNDYDTPDGSCIRDFIHIEDLVDAHIASIDYIDQNSGFEAFNVATGKGTSVYELISSAEKVIGKKLEYNIEPRRAGDPARLISDPSKIIEKMKWKAKYDIDKIVEDSWEYEQKRPLEDYKSNFR